MATTVDPREHFGMSKPRGAKHNWDQWCDGTGHQLWFGQDLPDDVLPSSLQSAFRQWAKRQGYNTERVHTRLHGADYMSVYVQPGALLDPQARRRAVEAGRAEGYPAEHLVEEG